MTPPNAGQTARERARAELTREIKEEAKRQLAKTGADGLSLRAVSRSLGMVSSALYRYFPSRDDLLTALIIDAYDAIGLAVEEALAAVPDPGAGGRAEGGRAGEVAVLRDRWLAGCRAVRAWARANPHEYALLYGSPVPGYRAPEATIGPAARVPFAMLRLVGDAAERGLIAAGEPGEPESADGLGEGLGTQADAVAAALADGIGSELPAGLLVRAVIAWTQVFGLVSFELFGQFVNTFDPADALFEHAAAQTARFVTSA